MLNRNKYLKDWENRGFLAVMAILFFYYGYRMFALTPWYDELYTYYYFISRGPVYAAIHWPLPNNHVGYSVLSGFLDLLGNAAIGLRGISFCSALANVWLIYVIGRRHFKPGWSLGAVFLYLSMNIVNQLAVQGRGYTLAVTCYLTALWMMDIICREERCGKRHYIIFVLSLTLGLYTLPSSVYWVIPLCLAGGAYLLWLFIKDIKSNKDIKNNKDKNIKKISRIKNIKDAKEIRDIKDTKEIRNIKDKDRKTNIYFSRLCKLIISAVSAAVMTVGLYTTIWLAIGSNLLSKDNSTPYYGLSHLKIIFTAPFQAIKTGIDYMLATPYIQSVEGGGFLSKLYHWFMTLYEYMQSGCSVVILLIVLAGSLGLIAGLFRKQEEQALFFNLYLLIGIVMLPVMLLVQHTLPYYRVFSFMGVLLAFLTVVILQKLLTIFARWKSWKYSSAAVVTGIALLALARLFSQDYNAQYGEREYELQDALVHSGFAGAAVPCVTDCTQQYLIKYLYDTECENQEIAGCDLLLLDKKMTDPEYDGFEWEFYHYYQTIPWEYVENNLEKKYENEMFVVYQRIDAEEK